jgi:hypothetical protein
MLVIPLKYFYSSKSAKFLQGKFWLDLAKISYFAKSEIRISWPAWFKTRLEDSLRQLLPLGHSSSTPGTMSAIGRVELEAYEQIK